MASNLKLGSNWKACGYLYDMRRWDHGNSRVNIGFVELFLRPLSLPQINFGFCKGDDNYGGVKRKELDDFLKSLGKSYNLVLYRMQVARLFRNIVLTRQSKQCGFSIYIFDNLKSKSMVGSEKMALSGLVFARKIARMTLIQNI